jgi:heptosyltransferase III
MRLVYHAGALGDFITTLPAMAAWRGSVPTMLLGRPAHAGLAVPPFDECRDAGSARFAPLFTPGAALDGATAALLACVEAALLFSAASSPLAANLTALGIRDVQRHDPFPAKAMHIVDYHLDAVGAGRLAGAVPRVNAEGAPGVAVGPGTVAIAPGSGSAAKNWPMDAFVTLSGLLGEKGMRVAWVMGPAEERLNLPAGVQVWSGLPLPSLAASLARCGLYVGNDSGVTHLAAACGCPTVALFGATDPSTWAPRGRAVRIITSPIGAVEGISIGEVLSACLDSLLV